MLFEPSAINCVPQIEHKAVVADKVLRESNGVGKSQGLGLPDKAELNSKLRAIAKSGFNQRLILSDNDANLSDALVAEQNWLNLLDEWMVAGAAEIKSTYKVEEETSSKQLRYNLKIIAIH